MITSIECIYRTSFFISLYNYRMDKEGDAFKHQIMGVWRANNTRFEELILLRSQQTAIFFNLQ
jgi:hypothetical protein